MRCPYCKFEDTKVIDSRAANEGQIIRRRRECLRCKRRFTTKEHLEAPLMVVKADGRREPYNQEKLKRSLQIACIKRPIPTTVIDDIVLKIEGILRDKSQSEVQSREIGEVVMNHLRELDEVAYVRFASVYRNFQDKEEFIRELEELKKTNKKLL